jgi:sporulation protein YlmC with PRC-barrel domain
VIRASELQGKRVRRENGEPLGRVYEIRLRDSKVTALICGARGFFQRLAGTEAGHRVDWKQVQKITPSEIIIAD